MLKNEAPGEELLKLGWVLDRLDAVVLLSYRLALCFIYVFLSIASTISWPKLRKKKAKVSMTFLAIKTYLFPTNSAYRKNCQVSVLILRGSWTVSFLGGSCSSRLPAWELSFPRASPPCSAPFSAFSWVRCRAPPAPGLCPIGECADSRTSPNNCCLCPFLFGRFGFLR